MGYMRLKVPAFVIIVLVAASPLVGVHGNVPTVKQLGGMQSGDDVLVVVEVRHASPSSNHYVNRVEVNMGGRIMTVDLSPQSTVTFKVNVTFEDDDLGSMKARAFCTIHGWSGWEEVDPTSTGGMAVPAEEARESENKGISGYPAESILIGMIGVIFLLWKSRRYL